MLKAASLLCFILMVAALAALLATHSIFSDSPPVIAAQVAAIGLMLWARVTFGRRSFHASADPTRGGIIRTGPYRFIRHPIYTAACLFTLAGVAAHRSVLAAGLGILVVVGALGRMLAEESFLRQRCPEYETYAAATRRMIPYVF